MRGAEVHFRYKNNMPGSRERFTTIHLVFYMHMIAKKFL